MSITPTYLFKMVQGLNTLDLTQYITVPSYKINKRPVFTDWQDGDLKNRQVVHRYCAEGSFTLLFNNIEDYQEFLEFYIDARNDDNGDGCVQVWMYINNTNEVANTFVHMDFEPSDTMPFMGTKEIDGIEVTIKEL